MGSVSDAEKRDILQNNAECRSQVVLAVAAENTADGKAKLLVAHQGRRRHSTKSRKKKIATWIGTIMTSERGGKELGNRIERVKFISYHKNRSKQPRRATLKIGTIPTANTKRTTRRQAHGLFVWN